MDKLPTSPNEASRSLTLLNLPLRPCSDVITMLLFARESFVEIIELMNGQIISTQERLIRVLTASGELIPSTPSVAWQTADPG